MNDIGACSWRQGWATLLYMAAPHPRLIEVLRETADRLKQGSEYKWANFGMCNCGHLAQTVTNRSPKEIHEAALERAGDWGQQALEYCGQTGLEIDTIMEELLALGLERSDIQEIERLSNPAVRRRMVVEEENVTHFARNNAIAYFETWADLLEEQMTVEFRNAAK